jgi:hypothetical protein
MDASKSISQPEEASHMDPMPKSLNSITREAETEKKSSTKTAAPLKELANVIPPEALYTEESTEGVDVRFIFYVVKFSFKISLYFSRMKIRSLLKLLQPNLLLRPWMIRRPRCHWHKQKSNKRGMIHQDWRLLTHKGETCHPNPNEEDNHQENSKWKKLAK